MRGHRLAGVAVVCLLIAREISAPAVVLAADGAGALGQDAVAPLFRVFLKDGRTLVSYGELARVEGRVVFSMPTTTSADNPDLHLIDLASERVDWKRTNEYAESARATRYLQTRAEADFTSLTGDIAQALNDIGLADDPRDRLEIVQRARKMLADWPPAHYNYKRDEVRQMLGSLDEAIVELSAALGAQRFDVSLSTAIASAPPLEELLPPPTVQQLIEQTLTVARLTDIAAERASLLTVAIAAIDRHAAELPVAWAGKTRASAVDLLNTERAIDRSYRALATEAMTLATARAQAADVRGVERVVALVMRRDIALGSARPDALNGIIVAVQDKLDEATRLRRDRDRFAVRLPDLRRYREAMSSAMSGLVALAPALEDIKALSGSGPDAIGAILQSAAAIRRAAALVVPPEELKELHSLLLSAAQMADSAARIRRQAAMTGDMDRAWNASSAAAGALMLTSRATSELRSAFRPPQLGR